MYLCIHITSRDYFFCLAARTYFAKRVILLVNGKLAFQIKDMNNDC